MAASALIVFTQNAVVGTPGVAYSGTPDLVVTVTNSVNTSVASWTIELVYAPPDSALATPVGTPVLLASASSNTPSATFTPDISGSYRIVLTVYETAGFVGVHSVDIRNFVVPTAFRHIVLPPYQKLPDPLPLPASGQVGSKPDELNLDDREFGWAGNADPPFGMHGILMGLDRGFPIFYQTAPTISTTLVEGASPQFVGAQTGAWGTGGTITLPAGVATGYVAVIQDVEGLANTKPITVTAPAGTTINGLASVVISRSYGSATLVRGQTTEWFTWGAKIVQSTQPILAGMGSTDQTGYQAIGGLAIDPTTFPNLRSVTLEVLLETSNAADTASFRLQNVTTSSTVGSSTLTTTALTPTPLSATISLASGVNVYEGQIKLSTGSPNRATCKEARLIVTWLQT